MSHDLMSENRRLRAALVPFAMEAEQWSDDIPDRYRPGPTEPRYKQAFARAEFNIGHLRRAARLLKDGV